MVTLRQPRSKVSREITKQISTGRKLLEECDLINNNDKLKKTFIDKKRWDDYNEQILYQFFSDNDFLSNYRSAEMIRTHFGWDKDIKLDPSYYGRELEFEINKMTKMIEQCVGILESVKNQLKIIPEHVNQIPIRSRVLFHPIVLKVCGAAFSRGEYDNAILSALIQLETEVRSKAGLSQSDYGTPLMRKAFSPNNGVLADPQRQAAEQTGIMELFAGVMGFHRNRQAHQRPVVSDPKEAAEVLILVSHLLRILGV